MMSLVLAAAGQTGDRVSASLAHNYIAASYYHWGRWDDALRHIDQAIQIRTEIGDMDGLAVSIDNRSQVLLRCGRYTEARKSSERGIRIVAEAGVAPVYLAHLHAEVGLASLWMGDFDTAERCFRHHLAFADECGSDSVRGIAYAHLGALALRRGSFTAALVFLEQAVELNSVGNPSLVAEAVCDLGSAHRGLGHIERGLHFHSQALATMRQCGFLFGECEVRIELAITLHLAGQDDEAKDQVNKALDIADRLNLQPQRAKALDVLATITDDDTLRAQATALYEQLGLPRSPITPTLEG
jgi:tetratricopeptide (TPR) repeat protein